MKRGGGITFDMKEGFSDRPASVSCGQCIGCRLRYSQEWALRCVHEGQLHSANMFLTLTYDNANIPASGSVDVVEWQTFAKRLRHAIGPFRFVHCGEYGERNNRPHYHALIFGKMMPDLVYLKGSDDAPLFTSELLSRKWGKGFCTVGHLTYDSAAYVARYVVAKIGGKRLEDDATNPYVRRDPFTGEKWYVKREYMTSSRNPGIGSGWFDKYSSDVYPSDEVVLEGRRHRPPRFYDRRFEEIMAEEMAEIKCRRAAKLQRDVDAPMRLRKQGLEAARKFRESSRVIG